MRGLALVAVVAALSVAGYRAGVIRTGDAVPTAELVAADSTFDRMVRDAAAAAAKRDSAAAAAAAAARQAASADSAPPIAALEGDSSTRALRRADGLEERHEARP